MGISELLTQAQTAEKLGVAVKTLGYWRCVKRYPLRYVKVGGRVMYRAEHVQQFIESCTMNGDGSERPQRGSARATRRGSR